MAAATDELTLLERVFLCLGNADTDEQLQALVCKFLPPVLLKLSSPQEGVKTKVMSLLIHINKRVKSRPKVQLPVEALLLQYQDPAANSFIINFTIIYIKLGYPRMDINKQAELVPSVLNAIEGKPLSHQDSLLLIIMPALGHIRVPPNAEKRAALLGLHDKTYVAKQLINFMLDMLLLPYGSVGQTENRSSMCPVPPGLSEYAFKRVIGESPPVAEQLEQVKWGIVKFLAAGFFAESDILIHLIVAAADTRFTVANLADMELRKIVSTLDWSSMQLALPLYSLFLGTTALGTQKDVKPDIKRSAANTRIRLKLLQYLCRVTKAGFIIPPSIQVIFDSLYGDNTNKKLKSLALEFTLNMVQQCSIGPLARVAGVILTGMVKLISEGESEHKAIAYTIVGEIGRRIPSLVNKDLCLVERLFEALTSTEGEIRRSVRDALIAMSTSFILRPEDESGIAIMNTLLSVHIESKISVVRLIAVHYAATVFSPLHAPSRYLLLLACGDEENEVSSEAFKALYGTAHKNEREKIDTMLPHAVPDFVELVGYINWHVQTRMKSNDKIRYGNHDIPYNITTYNEIIKYLRFCLVKSAKLSVRDGSIDNLPCEYTPIIARYMKQLLENNTKCLDNYLEIITPLNHATSDKIPLTALLEVVGTIPPSMTNRFVNELSWIRTLLRSSKPDVCELAAKIYAIVMAHNVNIEQFELHVSEFINLTTNKLLEHQYGALLALSFMFERKLISQNNTETAKNVLDWTAYINAVKTICTFLTSNVTLLVDAAVQGIGIIGKTFSLPLQETEHPQGLSKKQLVDNLFAILTNVKMNHKIKENAAQSIGLICIGESFPYTKTIISKFIEFAKETKDIMMHFTIAETLVLCVQGTAALEARDMWTTLPNEYVQNFSEQSDNLLSMLLDELLKLAYVPHPNSRQASCIWLLAILRRNSRRKQLLDRLSDIQSGFMDFLSENNEIVQDVASKGICLVYDTSEESGREILISNLLSQLSEGRRTVAQVDQDTKLFDEGQLGKAPTGGSITTYREICSLASDLNKPDLIYKFLHLANHNTVWTSKKGAAYGFSAIASVAKTELSKHASTVIPKLYRYQFDPTPKIQQSMSSIWHAIVPSTQEVIGKYHNEMLEDITKNLTNAQWRVRISCCHALADLLNSNAPIDFAKHAPKLWTELFRVMDDYHEDTRNTATNTAKVFSKACVRQCDVINGNTGEKVLQAILPIFLDIGILHTVGTVRQLSLHTVTQLVSHAGMLLKPSLVNLIPALLTATDMENSKLTYMSTAFGGQSEYQEAIDSLRTSAAKSHYATETMKKCTQYLDESILKELMPKVIDLLKSGIGLGSKVAISHFLISLSAQMKQDLQPYAGKLLNALMNGLTDRNGAIRKTNAVTIGHIIGSAKDSSLEKLFKTLYTWYMEKEDDSIRLAIGHTLKSITYHNYDVLHNYFDVVIPLTFFAMHAIVPNNENTIELWRNLWDDITHNTESMLKQYLADITNTLNTALESASWTAKAQAANAIKTVATKVSLSMDDNTRNGLLNILINRLQGRTWDGKEHLVNALAILACNSKDALKNDVELNGVIIDTLYRESKKENIEYRRHALKAFADVLHDLEIDRFTLLYDIVQEILVKLSRKNDDDDDKDIQSNDEAVKTRENRIKLKEAVYEALGKAWPSSISSKETQNKYCLQFVMHCHETLPGTTRPIQVTIMTTLNLFVEKLIFLKINVTELTSDEKDKLHVICNTLHQILKISVGISKYTKIRQEALNIILLLSKRLIDCDNKNEIDSLKNVVCQLLPELSQDNQPEIRSRMLDIKGILKI